MAVTLVRLKEVTYLDGGAGSFAYDAGGNRTQLVSGGQTTTDAYDDADQLTAIAGAQTLGYAYDQNGNRVSAGPDTFRYDWANRLVGATVGGTAMSYADAGDDVRVSRTLAGTTTPYLWDRKAEVPELVDDGTNVYLQLDGGELAAVSKADHAATYPLADALGSARGRTDGAGAVVARADYDAWGNPRAAVGAQGLLGWAGELRDAATGFTHLRARDYAPASGRLLQRDTVVPNAPGTQGHNSSADAATNPATLIDPFGGTSPSPSVIAPTPRALPPSARPTSLHSLVRWRSARITIAPPPPPDLFRRGATVPKHHLPKPLDEEELMIYYSEQAGRSTGERGLWAAAPCARRRVPRSSWTRELTSVTPSPSRRRPAAPSPRRPRTASRSHRQWDAGSSARGPRNRAARPDREGIPRFRRPPTGRAPPLCPQPNGAAIGGRGPFRPRC